jgi:hypothetical protein
MKGNFIRLSPEDLKEVGREKDAVLMEDGTGVGLINSHHEVHCVVIDIRFPEKDFAHGCYRCRSITTHIQNTTGPTPQRNEGLQTVNTKVCQPLLQVQQECKF